MTYGGQPQADVLQPKEFSLAQGKETIHCDVCLNGKIKYVYK